MSAPTASEERDRRVVATVVVLVILLIAGIPTAIWIASARSSATFSDTEILENNRLGAATLDIEVGTDSAVFDARNLAPGDRVSGHVKVSNVGSLPLILSISATSSGGVLAEWLRFAAWTVPEDCRPDDVEAGRATVLADDFAISSAGTGNLGDSENGILRLAPDADVVLCLGASLALDAGNEVQGQSLSVNLILDAVHDLEGEES